MEITASGAMSPSPFRPEIVTVLSGKRFLIFVAKTKSSLLLGSPPTLKVQTGPFPTTTIWSILPTFSTTFTGQLPTATSSSSTKSIAQTSTAVTFLRKATPIFSTTPSTSSKKNHLIFSFCPPVWTTLQPTPQTRSTGVYI